MITNLNNNFKFVLSIIVALCLILPAMAENKYQLTHDTPNGSNRLPVDESSPTYTNLDNNVNPPNTLNTPYNTNISPSGGSDPAITNPDSNVTTPNTLNTPYNTDTLPNGISTPKDINSTTNTLTTPYRTTVPDTEGPNITQVDLSVIKKILGAWKIDGDKYIGTLRFVLVDNILTARCYFFMYNSWQNLTNVSYDGLNIIFEYEDPLGEVMRFNGKVNKKLNNIKGTYVNTTTPKVFKWEALR